MPRSRRAGLPTAAELRYLALARRTTDLAQAIILQALAPLLAIWPSGSRSDEQIIISTGPLSPALPSRPVSDADLRRLWPGIDPREIREWAPWATSHEAVARVAIPAGRPISDVGLQSYVQSAITASRRRGPMPPAISGYHGQRGEDAFVSSPLRPRMVPPPVIFDARGVPILPPAAPSRVTVETIREAMGWADVATHQVISEQTLSPVLDELGRTIDKGAARELRRVIPIDIRAGRPEIVPALNAWRDRNVALIESGVFGPLDGVRLRPLLPEVSRLVEESHRRGLRVEVLAGELEKQFGLSKSRSELIARDQTLKLNGQIRQYQQRAAGVTRYRWIAMMDDRTRDQHRELNNTVHSWDAPPEVAPGRFEHPGGDYQCRCISEPILPWLTDE